MHSTVRLVVVPVVGISLAFGLSGCFANPLEQLTQGGVEQIIESQTGSDISVGGGGSLPDTFPASVPVLDGDIFHSQTIDGSWLVDMYVDSLEEAEAGYQDLLAAGFTETAALELGELTTYMTDNEQFGVSYVIKKSEGEPIVVSYTVVTKG